MSSLVKCYDEQLKGTEFVKLEEFMKFNKILHLNVSTRDLAIAIESSKVLKLNDDKTMVKRVSQFNYSQDHEECTIYIERLPVHADHEWIKSVFSCYGNVEYISLPRFKHNGNIMGFAFVEFDTPEAAKKACLEYNKTNNEQVTTENKNPHKVKEENTKTKDSKMKRTLEKEENQDKEETKKIKLEEKQLVENEPNDNQQNDNEPNDNEPNDKQETTKEKKKKKRRRKQKKEHFKDNIDNEQMTVNLRVMSKKEWKNWKNKYLKLQKATMSRIKQSLLFDEKPKIVITEPPENEQEESDKKETFTPGLIVKLKFTISFKDTFDETQFKQKLRSLVPIGAISYIELDNSENVFKENETILRICYIRFKDVQVVNDLIKNESLKPFGDYSVLSGSEEKSYWNKINEERQKIKSGKRPIKNRGFDKLINKSEKIGNKFL